jgi:hypothetical protein
MYARDHVGERTPEVIALVRETLVTARATNFLEGMCAKHQVFGPHTVTCAPKKIARQKPACGEQKSAQHLSRTQVAPVSRKTVSFRY